ncbi:hypothetical protein HT031_000631 [Scenedesmus sp. PABB004]|nr:hypothetical protein HT031_000631 [Scenedesmus sp. PABB004]
MSSDAQRPPPSNKLEEQARAKGDLSYSSWASTDRPANAPDVVPRKLSAGEAAAMQQQQPPGGEPGGVRASSWNAAGTFEERSITEPAKQQLQQALLGVGAGGARVTRVSSVTGDAHVWFVRGTPRCGFDFNIELAWACGGGAEPGSASGTLRLPVASPDELDGDLLLEDVKLDAPSGDAAADAAALAAARGLKPALEEALREFYAALKRFASA